MRWDRSDESGSDSGNLPAVGPRREGTDVLTNNSLHVADAKLANGIADDQVRFERRGERSLTFLERAESCTRWLPHVSGTVTGHRTPPAHNR